MVCGLDVSQLDTTKMVHLGLKGCSNFDDDECILAHVDSF
jgi:hypothetical protein